MKKFYDTSSLLSDSLDLTDVVISSISILELENIKVSARKDEATKYASRMAVRAIKEQKPHVVVVTQDDYKMLLEMNLEATNDNLIITCAKRYSKDNKVEFWSEDFLCGLIANSYFGLTVNSFGEQNKDQEYYTGYKVVVPVDDDFAAVYDKDNTYNVFDCKINEYVSIKDINGVLKDVLKWTGNKYISLNSKNIKSLAFGDKLKPKDEYQRMAIDSLYSNTITAIGGHAGSGKSLLCLATAMNLIEAGKYDRLVILFNPCPVRGASEMGYYTGSMIDKAMQSNIGNILISKFGDRFIVDNMITSGKIKLISMADCRGTEIRDSEILWITEAENTTIDLMKVCLSRVATGAKVFIEGDYDQIDHRTFESNNGLKRAVEVLKDNIEFGFVELQTIYRSRLAELVDKM